MKINDLAEICIENFGRYVYGVRERLWQRARGYIYKFS
jgi:hypothetical protein